MRRAGSKKYKSWRRKVYRRDKYTCQKCGIKSDLNAHHIDGFAIYPKKRYWASNGITLCARCHYLYHENYMGGSRKSSRKIDFLLFMKDFNVLEDHPIDPVKFLGYIKV